MELSLSYQPLGILIPSGLAYLSWNAAWRPTIKFLWGWAFTICSACNSEKSMASPVWCCVTLYLLISLTAYHVRVLIIIPESTLPNPPSPMRALNIIEPWLIADVATTWSAADIAESGWGYRCSIIVIIWENWTNVDAKADVDYNYTRISQIHDETNDEVRLLNWSPSVFNKRVTIHYLRVFHFHLQDLGLEKSSKIWKKMEKMSPLFQFLRLRAP